MKLIRIGQGLLALAASAGIGFGVTSCSSSQTIDYLFVTSNSAAAGSNGDGQITSYHVDSQSGAISQVAGTPVDSKGVNPVAAVASPNQQYLYVANHGGNNISEFSIGTDGQLIFGHSYTTAGSEPLALAINSAGTLLFVLDYYGPGFSDTTPGPGILIVYPINSDGTLGTPVASGGQAYTTVQCFPGGVAVSADGSYAYVTNTNSVVVTTSPPSTPTPPATPTTCPTQGTISGFSVTAAGALTPAPGSPFPAGTTPTAVAVDLTSRFVYATDSVQNQLIVYQILGGGALQPLTNGPFTTGTFPVGIVIDPRDEYLYVTNFNSSTISAYTISQVNGQPSGLATSSYATHGVSPTCIVVDPAFGRFVYTSLSHDNLVAAAELSPNTGELTAVQNSPYTVSGTATCVAAVAHGNHASQYVTAFPGQ